MNWHRITQTDNIPPREGRAVQLGDREVAIFNLGNRFAAIENRCPHSGGPLCDGILAGTTVVCPLHGWKIDVETGAVKHPQVMAHVSTYPVRVENGIVMIELPEKQRKEVAA